MGNGWYVIFIRNSTSAYKGILHSQAPSSGDEGACFRRLSDLTFPAHSDIMTGKATREECE